MASTVILLFSQGSSHSSAEGKKQASLKDSLGDPSVSVASMLIAGFSYLASMVFGILGRYGFFAAFFAIALLATGVAAYSRRLVEEKRRLGLLPRKPSAPFGEQMPPRGPQESLAPSQVIYVKKFGRTVRLCCYQTARLGDQYCVCGGAIEPDLLALFRDG